MDIDLSGRKAFISGSTQGIGRAIAAGLARSGAAVTVNGRDEQRVEALRGECPGAEIDGVAADVATAEGAQRVFNALPTTSGSSLRRRCSRSTTRRGSATGRST